MKTIIGTDFYRWSRTRQFWMMLFITFCSSFSSILLVAFLKHKISDIPMVLLEPLYSGGYYNFGVLKVKELSMLQAPSLDGLLIASYSGYLVPAIISIFTATYVGTDYKEGGFRLPVGLKHSRKSVYFSKLIVVVSSGAIYSFVFRMTIVVGSKIFWGSSLTEATVGEIASLMIRQGVMLLAFTVFAFAVCITLEKTSRSLLLLLSAVFALPMLLHTIDLMLPFRFSFGSIWIITQMMAGAALALSKIQILWSYLISLLFIVTSLFLGTIFFQTKEL